MRGKANEGLILFKPHFAASCPTHSMKRLSATARRFYFDCPCPIWIQGRLPNGDKIPRQTTGVNTLKEAEAYRDSCVHQRVGAIRDQGQHGPTIAECIETYLTARTDELSANTLRQTRLLLARLQAFSGARNVIHIRGLTVDLLEKFKSEGLPDLKSTSKSTAISKLRRFLREAYRRDWIRDSLVDKISTHKAVYEQKQPYGEDEVEKILAEAERLTGGRERYAAQPLTFRLLLELMLSTGMRVGDAVRLDPQRMKRSELFWVYSYYPQKQKKANQAKVAEAYITDQLKQAIDACTWMTPGKRPFYFGSNKNPAYLSNEVYKRMKTIGARCCVEDCRPHRLRDTFAVRCLLRGMALENVSRLLNHSSVRVTEIYYSPWVTARKLQLERLLGESLMNA